MSFSFGETKLFSDLNLSLPEGSICAILGPNGTGKTTLLHLLLGWLKPDDGVILLNGKDLQKRSSRERGRTISLLPQKENLSFEYSVAEYILLGRAPYLNPLQQPGEKDRKIAFEALATAGGTAIADRKIPRLSGGETQVCLMARSLTQEPEILLLDEPTNHLDLSRKREMINLMKSYRTAGKTVIFTTHDPELAARTADYLILIGPNREVKSGPFDKLFTEENLSAVYGIAVKIVPIGDGSVTVVY
ncbi:MAG: ABC transporter ATP-binding protein [Spirochaetales bacterium]|nr:ABC transporter ATP-binding protein [Spirochaetales bacterium]